MNREDLIFRTYYSFYLETMLATFYGRLDRMLAFIQILLGSAVLASVGFSVVVGAVITAASAMSLIWQPAKSAMLCDIQAKKMKTLINTYEQMDDETFRQAYLKAEEADSPCIGYLRDPAMKRTHIRFDNKVAAKRIKLTRFQSLLSHLAGDLPKDEDEDDSPN